MFLTSDSVFNIMSGTATLDCIHIQVTYDNHKHFSSHSKGSKPSPVRIYTNLPAPGMELPVAEGYRLCVPCNRFVAKGNDHCIKCDSCTSKVCMYIMAINKINLFMTNDDNCSSEYLSRAIIYLVFKHMCLLGY